MPNALFLASITLALPDESPLPDVVQTAEGAQAVNRSSVAALAFLLYDICLTFDEEVNLFWPRKWTCMKLNFFFIRYIPFLVQIPLLFVGTELTPLFHFTSHDCFIWQVYQGVASVCIIMSCDYVLLSRIYALYFNNLRIRYLVSICYILEIAIMSIGLGLALPGIQYDEKCTVLSVPTALLIYAGGPVAFQTLLFILTLYQFLTGLRMGWGDIPIVKLLMRDGTSADYDLPSFPPSSLPPVTVEMVAEASLYALKNHAFAGIFYAWLLTGYSFCGYRVLLNINHLTQLPESATTGGTFSRSLQFSSNLADLSVSYEMSDFPTSRTETTPGAIVNAGSDSGVVASSAEPSTRRPV
ncbi:hypothetical protein V5O48_004983 [Marasmius crinis-equi]|uniref:DUF6533 domain-containing protein n=1 Tax=Marasmius crinis-equi TaxID=585013 RepID=A0ABR3FNJ1_9AGAR